MATRYWVGGSSNWDNSPGSKWATTSGGTGGASAPTTGDTAVFDSNSGSDAVQIGGTRSIATLNCTGFTGSITNNEIEISTSVILDSTMSGFASNLIFAGTTTLTTDGLSLYTTITVSSGTLTLQDALTLTSYINLAGGTLTFNNFNVTATRFQSFGTTTRVLNLGTGTFTLTSYDTLTFGVFEVSGSNLTINPSTSTIKLTSTASVSKEFSGGGYTYSTVWFSGINGTWVISGGNTFTELKISPALSVYFPSYETQTVTTLTATGTLGNVITLRTTSTSPSNLWTISKASGTVSLDYVLIRNSTATGGATFYAGANSTDAGNNTGWIFSAAPSGASNTHQMFMVM